MALIRNPVIPICDNNSALNPVEGEIININNGESIGIQKNGKILDVLDDMAIRILEDESIKLSSDIEYSNSIGFFDRDNNVLLYKKYGVILDMGNSDSDNNISHYAESYKISDIIDFIDNFLGFTRSIDETGAVKYSIENFYFSYTKVYNKILFRACKYNYNNDMTPLFDGNDRAYFKVEGRSTYNISYAYKFTYKYYMVLTSILWMLFKSTDMDICLEALKWYKPELCDFFSMIKTSWLYDVYKITPVVCDAYVSSYLLDENLIYPDAFNGSSDTYSCTRFVCNSELAHLTCTTEDLGIEMTDDSSTYKTNIKVTYN